MVNSFDEFCEELMKCGFSLGGGNAKGIYSIVGFDWKSPIPGCPVRWHTGDPETDPWEWRMRVLEERKDIAYGKVFFGTSGYITKEWYPFFLAARRQGMVFDEWYDEGKAGRMGRKIYEAICENGPVALHDLKRLCGIANASRASQDSSDIKKFSRSFDRALLNLQKNLFITMCGSSQKRNKHGEAYGWNSTVFNTVEAFWGEDLTADISAKEAYQKIHDQVLRLNPDAQEKVIRRFIL